ncbi:ead/Ea22-like family protein, partial [Klebsiella pneumoniae]|nr:ead/Ea22-like family protein [Klebsiella pneumoniae]
MTTDITELAQSLKAAAEKATPGNWRAFQYHDGRCGVGGGNHDEIMVCEHISKKRPHDALFIAMANPANVLALVEALDKAQQQMTESENRVRKQNRHICELFDDNTALRQRIAELESRTVTVKMPKPHAHLIWIQAGHAPDDYWDDVAVSHSEKDRCCDGSERYPVYARWEIEGMLTA